MMIIRESLDNIETSETPRTQGTTEEMPHVATDAVQRASDVRVTDNEKEGTVKQANLEILSSLSYTSKDQHCSPPC